MKEVERKTVLFCIDPAVTLHGTWKKVIEEVHQLRPNLVVGVASFGQSASEEKIIHPGVAFVDELNELDILNINKSAEAIEQFDVFASSPSYQRFRFAALKLLNRKDFTGTLRFLEREVIVENAVLVAMTTLIRRTPSLLVFDVTPHQLMPFVFYAVAEWLGISTLHFSPSPVSPAMMPMKSFGVRFALSEGHVADSKVAGPLVRTAKESIEKLQRGIAPTYMQHQIARDIVTNSFHQRFRALSSAVRWLFCERFPDSIDFGGHPRKSSFIRRALKIFLTRSLQKTLKQAVMDLGYRLPKPTGYAIFALHYEPERTSIPDGFPFDSQTTAICKARGLLPPSHELVVKEHYSQQSSAKRGFLGRSPLFYDMVSHLDGVSFASTSSGLIQLLAGSSCVFTLTGTIALEAVLRGVPVAYFGNPWWEGLPGTIRIESEVSFESISRLRMPEPIEVEEFVVGLTSHHMVPGLAGEKVNTVESRLGPLPFEFFEEEARSIALCISSMLLNNSTGR